MRVRSAAPSRSSSSANGHAVHLIDKETSVGQPRPGPRRHWLLADACEVAALEEAELQTCDVVIAATGDDKANLVISLLAKTEFGVPRTVARVNNPKNEWLFDEAWGVDVAVSTPRLMRRWSRRPSAVGDLVRIFTFHQARADILELTLPDDSALVGVRVGQNAWPADAVARLHRARPGPIVPSPDDTLEARDELLFVTGRDADEKELELLLTRGPASS